MRPPVVVLVPLSAQQHRIASFFQRIAVVAVVVVVVARAEPAEPAKSRPAFVLLALALTTPRLPLPSPPDMAQPGTMVPSGDRAQLIASAVSFLRDPATASSPLAQRIAFLESKGLAQPDIELALQQAGAPAPAPPYPGARGGYPGPHSSSSPYGGNHLNEFQRDWRDWFIMGVVGGGVGWLAVKLAQVRSGSLLPLERGGRDAASQGPRLCEEHSQASRECMLTPRVHPVAQKFLVPHLQPPTETDLEASQRALEAKYDEAAELLKTLQDSTDAVAASLDEQKRDIDKELDEVRGAVKEMREGEKKRDEWAQSVGRQVDDMVKSLPGVRPSSSLSSLSCSWPLSSSSRTDISPPPRPPAAPRQASLGPVDLARRPPDRAQVAQVAPHRAPPGTDLVPFFVLVPLFDLGARRVVDRTLVRRVLPPVQHQAARAPRLAAQELERRARAPRFARRHRLVRVHRPGLGRRLGQGQGPERERRPRREA